MDAEDDGRSSPTVLPRSQISLLQVRQCPGREIFCAGSPKKSGAAVEYSGHEVARTGAEPLQSIPFTYTMTKPRYDKALFKAVGQAVLNRRVKLEQSHEELGEKTMLGASYIKEIEGGLRNLNIGTLSKVSRALGYSLSELFVDAEALMLAQRND
jgi:ribosome-binding protein aMBF1 (putative translation factor)